MRPILTTWTRTLGFAAGIAGLAAFARGQDLLQSSANVISYSGQPVPGLPGVTFSTASNFDQASIDDSGSVLFRARIAGTGVTPQNERAFFRGTSYANLTLLIRSGDPAPGIPDVTLNTASGTGIGGSPRVASNGYTFWGSSLSGTGVTTANDTALFGGFAGNLILIAREGDPAPGTAGAVLSGSLANLSHQGTAVNRNGQVLFQSAVSGGDTVTANNAGWFSGSAGSLVLVQRKGDPLGGAVIGSLGFVSQLNDSGQVMIDAQLSQTLGATPATAANDQTLWIYTPGVGTQLVAREGDPAPGTVGATLNHGTNNNSFFFNAGGNVFNNSGEGVVHLEFKGGDAIPGVNDRALFLATPSGLTMLIRRGAPAPGTTNEVFDTFNYPSMHLNNSGQIAFVGVIAGAPSAGPSAMPGSGTGTTGIWAGTPANLQLVVREGDSAPGTAGATFGAFLGQPFLMNEQGRVLFATALIGGDAVQFGNDRAYYCWDPVTGLQLVLRGNDSFEVEPGVTRTLANSVGGHIQFGNADGNPLSFNRNGQFVLRQSFTVPVNGSNGAIVKFDFPTCNGPSLVTQPSNVTTCAGTAANFSFVASGQPAPTYQWLLNGMPISDGGAISGATTASLTIDPVAPGDFGGYSCEVTGSCGTVTTSSAALAEATTDTDGDGTPDCTDGCPDDPTRIRPGACGCGVVETDTDGDGVADCIDNCDETSNPGQEDGDLDGLGDACDNCPTVSNRGQEDCDDDGIGDACAGRNDCNENGIPDSCDISGGTSIDSNGNGIPDECERGVTAYCFGDGSGTPCPCANESTPGSGAGCKNSKPGNNGCLLEAVDSTGAPNPSLSVTANELGLKSSGMLAGSYCIFFQGTAVANGGLGVVTPAYDGILCVDGSVVRLGRITTFGGTSTLHGVAGVAGLSANAQTLYYQTAYRNAVNYCTPATLNTSNALQIHWEP